MTKDEMKLTKFKTMVDDLYGSFSIYQCYQDDITSIKILFGEQQDDFLDILINRKLKLCSGCYTKTMSGLNATIESLIKNARVCINCNTWKKCNEAGQTIFLALLALAINDDLYNEKLEIVADFAYLIGFREDMMEDWLSAVKKYLLAEKINTKDMKTSEAQNFFSDVFKLKNGKTSDVIIDGGFHEL